MKKEYLYAGVSIFLWSTTATASKLLLGSLSSMQVLAIGSAFAFLFLVILNWIKGNFKLLKKYRFKDYAIMVLIGVLGTFLYNLLLYWGLERMQASQAFIINYLWPLMAVVFACVILREAFTVQKIAAVVLSFLGVIIVTSNGSLQQPDTGSLVGAVCCVLAAVCYGLFTVLTKRCSYDSCFSMMIYHLVAFVLPAVYMLVAGESFLVSLPEFLGLGWLGTFTSGIAFTTWALALRSGDTAKISNLAYITPFASLVWTWLILKEPLSLYSLLGLLLIVSGIAVQLLRPRRK